jgi:hypothetical protein
MLELVIVYGHSRICLNQKPAFIRKPISIDELVKRVKAELPDS